MKRTLKRGVALLLTVVMMMAMMSVCAFGYTEVAVTGVSIDKTLTVKDHDKAPNATFTYSVKQGDSVVVENAGSVTFADEDVLTGGAVTKNAALNLSALKYSVPGVYQYSIVENATTEAGMTADSRVLTLDVFVADVNGELVVTAVVSDGDKKANDFESTFDANKLTLKKVVAGNQGDKSKKFTFAVKINAGTGCAGDVIKVGSDYVTLNENGVYENASVQLGHNETLEIVGLAASSAVTYEIVETAEDGYTTTIEGTATVNGQKATGGMATDASVTYTNTKAGTIPTGVILTFAPYVLMVLGAAAIGFVFFRRRQHDC